LSVIGLAALAVVVAVLAVMPRPASHAAASTSATSSAPAAAAPVEVEIIPAWIVPRAGYARDGSRIITLQLEALRDLLVRGERIRPVLVIRCLARQTEVFVALGTSANPEAGDEHSVTVRFDDEPPAAERWTGSTSYQELFAPDGLTLAQRLGRTHVWEFTFTPFNSRPVIAQFMVDGLNQHIGSVARACRWPAVERATR
jgi:hypothetical protein